MTGKRLAEHPDEPANGFALLSRRGLSGALGRSCRNELGTTRSASSKVVPKPTRTRGGIGDG